MLFMVGALAGKVKAPHALPPVLNSPFFLVHVVIAFIGYAAFTLNLGLAIGALFAGSASNQAASGKPSRLGSLEELLGLARRLVPWGLLTLGTGIALGGVWALFSWGTWWGWDPKETGALVTWLSYVVYVHSPTWKGPARRAEAWLPIAGYVLLLVTFLGINLLKWGVHAYQ